MNTNKKQVEQLEKLVANIQLDRLIMYKQGGQDYSDDSFSVVELLAVLYGKQMKIDPKRPEWEERDRLVLAKSQASLGLYSVLANVGYFDKEWLFTMAQSFELCQRLKIPGIDVKLDSLKNGPAVATGMALGLKLAGKENNTYLIMGNKELMDEQSWEVFWTIAQFKLNHCRVIIVNEEKREAVSLKENISFLHLKREMERIGFYTLMVDGTNVQAIDESLEELKKVKEQAVCLILVRMKE
ncbi:hypothetical protein [Enterococcus villorum]|uniref:hypothetical protein n=1 Tax=Enterococcus villorum TaxID=112904 RepID=UPI0009C039BA|nr:hypothetical protein [Enterococcus villorum]